MGSRPPVLRTLVRGLRGRCPVCGLGPVFHRHRFRAEETCRSCGWRFERGPGHWLGGSEVNMLLAFPLGIAVSVLAGAPLGWPWWVPFLGAATSIAVSLAFYRRSRALFYAFDWLLDPEDPSASEDWDRDGDGLPAPGDGAPSLWAVPDPRIRPPRGRKAGKRLHPHG